MAKYKPYDYSQSLLIPVSLQEQLMPGTLEFAIHTLVEGRMDMSVFDSKYQNDETGRRAYDPKVLLKVVLLAYTATRQHDKGIAKAEYALSLNPNSVEVYYLLGLIIDMAGKCTEAIKIYEKG